MGRGPRAKISSRFKSGAFLQSLRYLKLVMSELQPEDIVKLFIEELQKVMDVSAANTVNGNNRNLNKRDFQEICGLMKTVNNTRERSTVWQNWSRETIIIMKLERSYGWRERLMRN